MLILLYSCLKIYSYDVEMENRNEQYLFRFQNTYQLELKVVEARVIKGMEKNIGRLEDFATKEIGRIHSSQANEHLKKL